MAAFPVAIFFLREQQISISVKSKYTGSVPHSGNRYSLKEGEHFPLFLLFFLPEVPPDTEQNS